VCVWGHRQQAIRERQREGSRRVQDECGVGGETGLAYCFSFLWQMSGNPLHSVLCSRSSSLQESKASSIEESTHVPLLAGTREGVEWQGGESGEGIPGQGTHTVSTSTCLGSKKAIHCEILCSCAPPSPRPSWDRNTSSSPSVPY